MTKARYILVALLVWIIQLTTLATNVIRILPVSVEADSVCTVEIIIENSETFVGFQTEIIIPAEFTYIDGSAALNPLRSSGHKVISNLVGNTLRILSWSDNNTSFTGTSGALLTFKLKAGKVPGEYPLALTNTLLSTGNSQPLAHTAQNGIVTIQGPNIQASYETLDFGRVALNESDTRYLTLNNTGNKNLDIGSISFTNSQFSSTIMGDFTLTAGQSIQVPVIFAPTIKGTYNEQITIATNDPDTRETSINLQAIGYAVNEIHLMSVSGRSGHTVTLPIHINNMESFTGFQIELALPEQVQYVEESIHLSSRKVDHSIMADTVDNTLVITSFSPSNSEFTGHSGMIATLDLYIEGLGGNYPIYFLNAFISDISATNILSDSYNSSVSIISPQIYLMQGMIYFGKISVLEEKKLTYTVSNYGSDSLKIWSVIPTLDVFLPDNDYKNQVISSGSWQEFGVTFKSSTKGKYNGSLILRSNDSTNDPVYIYLSGETFEPNQLTIKNAIGSAGSATILDVELDNYSNILALQFDLHLPVGFSINTDNCQLTDRTSNHVISANYINSQTIRFLVYSMDITPFKGNSGVILQIPVDVGSSVENGTYNLNTSDVLISNDVNENVFSGQQDGLFTVTALTEPKVVTPSEDEIEWNWGKTFQITWEDFAGSSVKIELLKGTEVIGQIVSTTSNDGLYEWTISSDFEPGSNYKIKITSLDNPAIFDISDSYFKIINLFVFLDVDAEPVPATLNFPLEFDWYRFQTLEAGQYTIQTFGTIDTFMELYHDDGSTLIDWKNDTLNDINAKVVRNLESNTWYRVKVKGNPENTTGNYTVGVSFKITNSNEILREEFSLINYPNPFEFSTSFIYYLPYDDDVLISVLDIYGRTIATIYSGHQSAGLNEVRWDPSYGNGIRIPGGIYFGQLISGNQKRVIRLVYKGK